MVRVNRCLIVSASTCARWEKARNAACLELEARACDSERCAFVQKSLRALFTTLWTAPTSFLPLLEGEDNGELMMRQRIRLAILLGEMRHRI